MRFSLVVATLGRVDEVRILLRSLRAQSLQSFEVILVDQNGDDRLDSIVAEFSGDLALSHVRSPVQCCNHARNLGARQAQGEILAFPYDDCAYTPSVLAKVDARFAASPPLDFMTGFVVTLDGQSTGNGRWLEHDAVITRENIWKTLIEFNFFIRRTTFNAIGGFDEQIGPGTRFGSAEGQDLALRILRRGGNGFYDRSLLIGHPDKQKLAIIPRAFLYGMGMGYVLRKNGSALSTVLVFMVRPFGGVVLNLLRGRPGEAKYFFAMLRGRFQGYRAGS